VRAKHICLLSLVLVLLLPCSANSASFKALGFLPGGNYINCSAVDTSADFSIVVGTCYSASGQAEAFRWSESTGMVGLGFLPGAKSTRAIGVSADGSVVVGSGDSDAGGQAFRWTESSGMVGLGTLVTVTPHPAPYSNAAGVSADGSVIVGGTGSDAYPHEAFRWTEGTGMVGIGTLKYSGSEYPPGWGWASAVSADGSVIVGTSYRSPHSTAYFRWTEAGGMEQLGYGFAYNVSSDGSMVTGMEGFYEPGSGPKGSAVRWTEGSGDQYLGYVHANDSYSIPYSMNADGSVIVGESGSYRNHRIEAFRWTQSTGMVGLGYLGGGPDPFPYQSWAGLVSSDGALTFGTSSTGSGGSSAFIWNESQGMRNLSEVLTNEYELDIQGWLLQSVVGISDDNLTIVGNAFNPEGNNEAWIARLTPPVGSIQEFLD
jgi:probable HAF family extracellular repeat protein